MSDRKVLVVEDEEAIAEAVRVRLLSEGFHVVVANDGPNDGWVSVKSAQWGTFRDTIPPRRQFNFDFRRIRMRHSRINIGRSITTGDGYVANPDRYAGQHGRGIKVAGQP